MDKKPRRFTDRRARRLKMNATVLSAVAALPAVGVASYSITAPELGTVGWTLISIASGLFVVAAACVWMAVVVQKQADRAVSATTAVAAAAAVTPETVPVAPKDPGPGPTPAAEPVYPTPPTPPAGGTPPFLPPYQRPVVAAGPLPIEPVSASESQPDPDPEPRPVRVNR